jgi:hypothetical protein
MHARTFVIVKGQIFSTVLGNQHPAIVAHHGNLKQQLCYMHELQLLVTFRENVNAKDSRAHVPIYTLRSWLAKLIDQDAGQGADIAQPPVMVTSLRLVKALHELGSEPDAMTWFVWNHKAAHYVMR